MPRVIPGHGRRQTSSPTSPRTELPSASTTSMSSPSAGKPSATGLIGSVMAVVRKHAPTSVPPEMFTIGTRAPPTFSKSHMYGSGFTGSPVVEIAPRGEGRPRLAPGDECAHERGGAAEHRHALRLDQPPEAVVGPVGRALGED